MPDITPRRSGKPKGTVLDTLIETFAVIRECRPLALGIHKAIQERLPGLNSSQLRFALKTHAASTRYLKALSQGQDRFDLDGVATGSVTTEQRQQAQEVLKDRFRKQAERRKAEQQAIEHQQNLLRLAERFNAR